ncbi:hypothetical protein [Streptomyces sp. MB09-02B]|uniref:hypothetical protein n=1 Tax=Streptomyces sp. MB09-02B TaxID=3028667 RepID=UPI0029B62859|nr:hypothetical protein [Streptomyces sp. MB09-02B]MDX3641147.1 hypothetical protein [Streptomyces sp. MB09-02B]
MSARAGKMGGRAVERRSERYTCRTPGVLLEVALSIKVRNAHEMVLWWDAQVPDRLPWLGSKAA